MDLSFDGKMRFTFPHVERLRLRGSYRLAVIVRRQGRNRMTTDETSSVTDKRTTYSQYNYLVFKFSLT